MLDVCMCISPFTKLFRVLSFSSMTRVTMDGLLKLLAFASCIITATAECTLSKYNQGTKDRLSCFGSNLTEVQSKLQGNLIVLSVSQSVVSEIPDLVFIQNATSLEDLKFHDCGITHIAGHAFNGLQRLKKLSLAYNNLTTVYASWFYETPLLEQLDLSFNKIAAFDSSIYSHLSRLQRLDLNDNLFTCILKNNMESMRQLKDIRIQENPLTYMCRAQLTDWLKHHFVNYATNEDNFIWLDSILWQCLTQVPSELGISSKAEQKMSVCVISSMFEQLTTVLGASPSIESSTRECIPQRQGLTQCLRNKNVTTNGDMIMNFLALANNVVKGGASL